MDWSDIQRRVAEGESELTEFKRGLGDLKPIGRALCGFANSVGGIIVLGVDDGGQLVGVQGDLDKILERLTGFLQTGLSSPLSARIGQHPVGNGWCLWIEVHRLRGFEPTRFDGRVYVRRSCSSVEPSPSELQELYNMFGYILTEERVLEAAGVGDIDPESFRDFLRLQGITVEDDLPPTLENDLTSRGVIRVVDGSPRATLYGVLAFGRDPQRYPQTRNFWVSCAAYGGADQGSDVLLVGEAKGRLDEQVERAMGWLRSLGHKERYTGLQREDVFLAPEAVVREALVNAVVHRDYSLTASRVLLEVFDHRVVITSPGTLPNHMTPVAVLAGGLPRSRNEWIAHFMLVRRQMEQRGRGWPLMRRRMREFNGTEPELEVFDSERFVRVTLRVTPP